MNKTMSIKKIEDEIYSVHNIISDTDVLIIKEELNFTLWQPSTVLKRDILDGNYYHEINEFRISETSHQIWFTDRLNEQLDNLEKKIELLFKVEKAYLEPWQALKYPQYGKVDYHLDAGYWQNDKGGERIFSFLLYLTTPESGGETHFRAHNLKIDAISGNMLVWNNLLSSGNVNHAMIHSGMPLYKGEKICLISWSRQNKYK
ncbi:2OG-Fe(II) oxygenase [Flavobacterium saccharophilum]|uniref:2OG-Fe(II) oxygenase superfamily protein n=1 Tax=Flavobacterium saccharophilum TaxID=29534 RepID=A0A1M7MCP9_9FLAO|nr:2OG-Fe(II) oxygenase [Flavobacterium saccharophilum]SHM88533.1 2OG-Fe(II) oxygenase superfamily protein [Flavobacterium saccharophilum]